MAHIQAKKSLSKNSHTEKTFESPPYDKDHSHMRPADQNNINMKSLNLNSLDSNVTTGLDSAHDKKIYKHAKKQDSLKGADLYNVKLTSCIRETFLDIRQRTLDESPNCVDLLNKFIPFDEPDEAFLVTDPILLLQYIKQIFDKTLELKDEAERELDSRNENEVNDYEGMLQKLEAEVRQHIRIEQQLKLYVESVQSKLDEQEKEGDLSKLLDIQKEMEGLQHENLGLNAKVRVNEEEIHSLKKKLARKITTIEKLERQIENIPILKKMVREMDRILDGTQPSRAMNDSTLRGSQRSSKEADLHGVSVSSHMNDPRARKSSHPAVVSMSLERRSHEHDKNKESGEFIRIVDASTTQISKDSKKDRAYVGHKGDGHSRKTSARGEESDDGHKRPRKSSKGDSNRHNHSRERNSDSEGYNIDNAKEMKALLNAKEDMIEPSKFSYDAALKAGMEEYLRKSLDKSDIKPKKSSNKHDTSASKRNKSHAVESHKDKTENSRIFGHKSSISKATRPGTGVERTSHHDHVQHSADHFSESYKQRENSVNSGKKSGHDRSQSVDPKKKLLRQHKSRGSINEDETDDTHKKQSSYSGYSKGVGSSKVNQSGSSIITKSHS